MWMEENTFVVKLLIRSPVCLAEQRKEGHQCPEKKNT